MSSLGYDFKVVTAEIDENVAKGTPPKAVVQLLAQKKARAVSLLHPNSVVVVGADTVVACKNKILGKPRDKEQAYAMLRLLAGKKHKVYTGVCVTGKAKETTFCSITEVEFFPLSDKEILDYIKTKEPFDKAGAYGIQGRGAVLVKAIKGDFYSVMGLPIAQLDRVLKSFLADN